MTKEEVFQILSSNPVFHIATVEDNQPRVRAVLLYSADENGILFHTAVKKELYHQIKKNPMVEFCFNSNGPQIRISGELIEVDDKLLKDEIAEHPTRGFLKAWRDGGIFEDFYTSIAVFRLKAKEAEIWTMETNFMPHEKVKLAD